MKKKWILIAAFLLAGCLVKTPTYAQVQELEELALDLQKLSQLKSILSNLYKGYEILTKGYNAVKDLSQGNFSLHKTFLDGLMQVSPAVRKYKKAADIVTLQIQLVKEYKSAFSRFKKLNIFNVDELDYLESVYSGLFDRSVQNLDELLMVMTANQLRMNDAERIHAIDRIYADIEDKLEFLRSFNNRTQVLAVQRYQELQENKTLRDLYGNP
jgi:hypothetical protein